MWDLLTQYYVDQSDAEEKATEVVAVELQKLLAARQNHSSTTIDHDAMPSVYGDFSEYHPELESLLHDRGVFRQIRGSSEHRMALDAPWIGFDPLTTSRVSVRFHLSLPSLPFRDEEELNSNAMRVRRSYGKRPYKCGFLHCSFHRTGFSGVRQRHSHEKYHEKPWKCSISGCEFEEGGFLSKKMRDDHLERAHNTTTQTRMPSSISADEKKLILLDLAKEGLIDCIRDIFTEEIDTSTLDGSQWLIKFCRASASSGSAPLLKFCISKISPKYKHIFFASEAFVKALTGPNTLDMFKEFIDLSVFPEYDMSVTLVLDSYLSIFKSLLVPECRSHFEHWLDGWVKFARPRRNSGFYGLEDMVRATSNESCKEDRLLQFWGSEMRFRGAESGALLVVARTTRSCRLAEYLLDRGAKVDYKQGDTAETALFAAASNDSAQAATLTKLLLLHGADPESTRVAKSGSKGNWTKTTVKVRDQKGARNIAKWLGMTWDELVADVQRQRKESGKT